MLFSLKEKETRVAVGFKKESRITCNAHTHTLANKKQINKEKPLAPGVPVGRRIQINLYVLDDLLFRVHS